MKLTAEQAAKLQAFEELLHTVAIPRSFVGSADASRVRQRHIDDSLRARNCLDESVEDVFDIGSGAGLPGVPIAIVEPSLRMTLIEPLRKRAAFLELVVERLDLGNVQILVKRAEDVPDRADACLARGVASASRSWALAEPLLQPGGRLVYFAGRRWSSGEATGDAPIGAMSRICDPSLFPWQGPIVMMTRRPD